MATIKIETERLQLLPLSLEDLDPMHRVWVEPGVRRFLWDDEIITKEHAAEVIGESVRLFEAEGLGLWSVKPRGEPRVIGFGGFWFFHDPPELQILYGVAEANWNQGFATEIARALIRYGFEELGLERIEASADAPNLSSLRVMEKSGMTFDKRVDKNGLDTVYYSITRPEAKNPAHRL
jgi:ribosomal-protein-alanine N-acetyltransferase